MSRLRTDPAYFKSKEEMEVFMKRLPYGHRFLKLAERLKDGIKYLIIPGIIFEELGFTYLDLLTAMTLEAVKSVLSSTKTLKGPVIVHLVTKKVKVILRRKKNLTCFTVLVPLLLTQENRQKGRTSHIYKVFADTLIRLAENRPEVVAITAAMPGTGLDLFANTILKGTMM